LEYPDDFEISANPAGKHIAISRIMAIWASVIFVIIIFLSLVLLWSYKSQTLSPVLISANDNDGVWQIVGDDNNTKQYTVFRTMQEYVIGNFVKEWFNISKDKSENDNAWKKCERDDCRSDTIMFGSRTCSLYCASGEDVYSKFTYNVLPDYQSLTESGNSWAVDMNTIEIIPDGKISENGGSWHITANVLSVSDLYAVRIFIKIARNKINYPHTMGFYVADFNAYRIN